MLSPVAAPTVSGLSTSKAAQEIERYWDENPEKV